MAVSPRRQLALEKLHAIGQRSPDCSTALSSNEMRSDRSDAALRYVRQLEPVTLELLAMKHRDSDVRYVMTVHHLGANAHWQHSRSFDEYVRLRDRLVAALHRGHYCDAGCPWLESFIQTEFPCKKRLFFLSDSSKRTMIERESALSVFFHRLLQFVLNPAHHTCRYLTTDVARELVNFIYGRVTLDGRLLESFTVACSPDTSDIGPRAGALDQPPNPHLSKEQTCCGVCERDLASVDAYSIRLSCGHRFHDECIVAKLNESMCCPVCKRPQAFTG